MNPVIEIDDLCKTYGTTMVVSHLTFTVEEGEIFGFIGPNGSGKTTTIKMLCGLVPPTSGTARIMGLDIRHHTKQVKLKVGYMSQQFGLYPQLTVAQNLGFYAQLYGLSRKTAKERRDYVVELTGLQKYQSAQACAMSGGWRQRLALACALIHDPPVVILDEPTAGVDLVARAKLWDLIIDLARKGKSFLVTTHYMDEVERCDSVAYMYLGKLIVKGKRHDLLDLPILRGATFKRLEVLCREVESAFEVLSASPFVVDAHITGSAIRLVVPQSTTIRSITRELAERSLEPTNIMPLKPSLEDVFVTLTELEEAGVLKH